MAKLAPLLDRLTRHDEAALRAGEGAAKLVIASGRRGRIEGEGDFETVSSQALSEDEVRDLLGQTGGGSRIDRLDGKNTEWTFRHEGATYLVDAIWDGRELRAVIRRTRSDDTRAARPVTSNQDARTSFREEFAPRRRDPRADESQSLGAVREERTVTRAKTIDPRADDDAPPPPREPTGGLTRQPAREPAKEPTPRDAAREPPGRDGREKRRDSRARRTTPRGGTGRTGSKRDLPKAEPPSEPRREGPAPTPRASADEAAWTQALGGTPPKRDPLFSLDKPDADVRSPKIEPDDRFARKGNTEQRVARAVTAHAPDISELGAMLAEAQAHRDREQQRKAALERERPGTDRGEPPRRPGTDRVDPPLRPGTDRGEPLRPGTGEPLRRPGTGEPLRRPGADRESARGRDPDLPPVFGIDLDDDPPRREPTGSRDVAREREPTSHHGVSPEREPTGGRDPDRGRVELGRSERREPPTREPTVRAPIDVEARLKAASRLEGPPPAPPPPSSPEAVGAAATGSLHAALEKLVEQARTGGASDLHVVAGRPAIARIGGALVPAGPALAADAVEEMVLGSIPAARRAAFERDGAASFACVIGTSARCRVAVSRQRTGLKASIRILPPAPKSLAELELPDALDQALRHHQGLIVVSGPSGQGKTTTLAALVDHLNTNTTHHVLTVEDPIEFVHPRKKAMMSQREVGTHTRSFANALRSSLRQDPDVIVVGELRDVETVRTALSASETGHLVLGTINTPSAPKTIDRLIDLFPPPEQPQVRATLAAALRLIASQRLLPRRDGGGRVAAVEILPGSLALSNLIRDNRTFQIPSLMQRGRAAGVVRLDDELLELVRRGAVDKKDAIAAADDPGELQSNLEGRPGAEGAARPRPATGDGAPPRPPSSSPDDADRGGKALWQRAADMFRRGGT